MFIAGAIASAVDHGLIKHGPNPECGQHSSKSASKRQPERQADIGGHLSAGAEVQGGLYIAAKEQAEEGAC